MRRTEIIDGVNQIVQALKDSNLDSILDSVLNVPSNTTRTEEYLVKVLEAMKSYSMYAKDFNDAAKTISRIMGLSALNESGFWSRLLSVEKANTPQIFRLSASVEFSLKYLPKFIDLIAPGAVQEFNQASKHYSPAYANKGVLSVLLIEEDDRFSSPDRLVEMLQSVNLLYEASLIITDTPHEKLGVIACDSGSDKSFDFMGAAKAVECVITIILSLWDRIVFYREKKLDEHIELIAKSLPIIEKISELEQQKKFGPEQAELLRRNIFNGVSKFVASGAMIPEIQKNARFNPRMLLAPEPKLLTTALPPSPEIATIPAPPDAGSKQSSESGIDDDLDFAQLNNEEREFLRSIVTKFRNSNAQKTADQNEDQDSLSNEEIDPNDE